MKCKECECCHLTSYTRWDSQKQCMRDVEVYECFGVKEPFEIADVNQVCSEYPERAEMQTECNICSGDYNQWLQSYIVRLHHGNEITAEEIQTHYCPNCGRKL